MARLNHDELVRLVQHIMTTSGCVVDLDALLNEFESNVSYPNAAELIFNPPSGKRMSAEEVVNLAMGNRWRFTAGQQKDLMHANR